MKLLLVRHARTMANVMGALDTAFPGQPLDATGLAQAGTLPERLERAGHLEGLSAVVDSGLREVLAGDLEMATDERSVACYRDTTRSWMAGRTACRLPGSPEDGVSTLARFDAVVERIAAVTAERGKAAGLLVAHGTVLRLWTALRAAPGGGADPLWVAEHPMSNAGVTVVCRDRAGWRLVDWNEGDWRA